MATEKEEKHIESDASSDTPSDDEQVGGTEDTHGKKICRNERKARKAISRLGMTHMPEIVTLLLKKNASTWFHVERPDVYKSPNSESYVVFGEVKVKDNKFEDAGELAKRFTNGGFPYGMKATEDEMVADASAMADIVEDEDQIDLDGCDPKDVDLVMKQTSCTKARAVAALKANDSDIVEAIMEITS